MAIVHFTTRWIGLITIATLLAGSVAAQDMSLPDPDGLDLPEASILDPGYDAGMPPAGVESLPSPHMMSTPMGDEAMMGPSRLVNEPHALEGAYDELGPDRDYMPQGQVPNGDSWHNWGPNAQPYSQWGSGGASPYSSGTWLDRGVWYGEADAVAFYRVWRRNDMLYAAADPIVLQPGFNSLLQLSTNRILQLKDSHPGKDIAVRATLGRFLMRDDHNRDHVAEFTIFGGGDWVQDAATFSEANQPLFTPFSVSGSQNRDFSGSTNQRMIYTSRFNSFELNYKVKRRLERDQMVMDPNGCWHRMANNGWNRHFLAGLRYFQLFEHVDWTAENIVQTGTDGRYIVNTRNDLFGAQVGCGMHYETGRWSLGANTKIGLYVNDADARSQLFFSDDSDNFDRFATEDELSFLTEFGMLGRYHVTPNASLRAGLDMLYFESVALAPDQLNFLPVYTRITTTGDPVYIGGSLGFECYW